MELNSFTVLPTTPPKLEPLLEIAYNMWFSWNWDARQVFARLDLEMWEKAKKNPLRMLCDISQEKLEEAAEDEGYVAEVEAVYASFKKYMAGRTWFEDQYGERKDGTIAYFCCEYGIHESLPIYSGGLGVLAGDHLKSASDLGVPLVAVGLLYKQGYFKQGLNANGDQLEYYPENDWFSIPVKLQKDEKDKPIILSMNVGGDQVFYQIWTVKVGRVSLHLLDTNLPSNPQKHREITKRLYDSDRDMRIRQELLLGVGGIKALKALDLDPTVYHINEGHSAFLIVERIRNLMHDHKLSYEDASEVVWTSNIFTTHTPVSAGNERFKNDLVVKYLNHYIEQIGISMKEFLHMGLEVGAEKEEEFCMTVLALKFAGLSNGVAKLHGVVSRDMWQTLYGDLTKEEVPIKHVTNGVHTKTWLNKSFEGLLIRYMNTAYDRELADFTLWKAVENIPNIELWKSHQERKKGLFTYMRKYLKNQLKKQGASAGEISKVNDLFDPNVLTIGFARRSAPYKRGDLLFRDPERLLEIVNNADRPVQFIFAGKAHPADTAGKEIIKKIFDMTTKVEFNKRVIFLENYDIDMARYLVQGVDVWLNTPIRPKEASGTSGMKAAINGALNLSILDGWWDEAFNNKNGWAIGHGEEYEEEEFRDEIEANLLYRLLEKEVAPTYYNKDELNVPNDWTNMVKNSMATCGEMFNAHRMVVDYIKDFYLRAEEFSLKLKENNYSCAKDLGKWRKKVENSWDKIEILEVKPPIKEVIYSGSDVQIAAKIKLGDILPENLNVEVYYGILDQENEIKRPKRVRMNVIKEADGVTTFSSQVACNRGGRYGYTVRVLPGHENLIVEFMPGLIKWHQGD